jgi:hypothetical protein
MGCGFCHLQFLSDTLSCHIARHSRRRGKSNLQASQLVNNKGDIGQSRATKPGLQLKSLLECLCILLVGGVFNGHGVITLADLAAFLHFALPLVRYIFKSREGSWVGDILGDVIL